MFLFLALRLLSYLANPYFKQICRAKVLVKAVNTNEDRLQDAIYFGKILQFLVIEKVVSQQLTQLVTAVT